MSTVISRPIRPRTSAFVGHETFHLRQTWLSKGLSAIGTGSVNFDDAGSHHELGIGINMLKSLAYWMQATRLARFTRVPKGQGRPFELTDIGKLVAAHTARSRSKDHLELVPTGLVFRQRQHCRYPFAFAKGQ